MDSDCLLRIDQIDGESQQKGHEKWIELLSWTWGEDNAGSNALGSGGGSGRVAMGDFEFTVNYGVSSPKLFLACATGQHIPKAVLHVRKAGGKQEVYMEWTFTDVLISRYRAKQGKIKASTSERVGSSRLENEYHEPVLPVETISFNFAKIEVEYRPQKSAGDLGAPFKAGFDVKRGCKI